MPQQTIVNLTSPLIAVFHSILHTSATEVVKIITVSLLVLGTPALACPLSCECRNTSVLEVSCKNGRLLNIFTQIDNTTYSLSLDHVIDLRFIKKAHFQDLKASDIIMLRITSSFVEEIAEHAFSELSHLEYLDLSGNKLETIYDSSFAGLDCLRTLNLSHNQLSTLGQSLQLLAHLVTLDLSANYLKDFPAGVFKSQNSLTFLKLDGNPLRNLQHDAFEGVHSVRELRARDCSLVQIEDGVFLDMPALSVIDLGHNRLTSPPLSSVLSKFSILRIMLLDHNEIKVLHQNIFEDVHLQTLDLSYNRISKIDTLAFNKATLWSLDLSYNSLISLNRSVLQPLGKQLTHLNLAGNPLHQMQTGAFEDLELLETLNLSSCSLDSLEHFHLQKLPLLRKLDISHNSLHFLSQPILDSFNKLDAVNLHENAWICDCHITFLRDWLVLATSAFKVQCLSSHEEHRDCIQLHCSLPSNLQNSEIVQLKDQQLGQCLQETTKTMPASTQGAIVASCLVFAIVLLIIAIFLWRRGQTHHSLKRVCMSSAAESSHFRDEDSKVPPLANCDRNSLTLSDHNFVFRYYFDHLVTDPKLMADGGEEDQDAEEEPITHTDRDSLYSSQPSLYSHHSDAGFGMESTV
ncbi:hypothetical protein BsWGS_16032 [Bradybaena similaris]